MRRERPLQRPSSRERRLPSSLPASMPFRLSRSAPPCPRRGPRRAPTRRSSRLLTTELLSSSSSSPCGSLAFLSHGGSAVARKRRRVRKRTSSHYRLPRGWIQRRAGALNRLSESAASLKRKAVPCSTLRCRLDRRRNSPRGELAQPFPPPEPNP